MADRLFLSLWLRPGKRDSAAADLLKVMQRFPVSRLAPRVSLSVRAISMSEAALFEDSFAAGDLTGLQQAAAAWTSADAAFEVDAAWDLLIEQGGTWSLRPVRVTILAFGSGFEREEGEDLRIEFGTESPFVPVPESPESFRYVQENIRSLLRLVKDIEQALPVARRKLWSESGENFAERLAELAKP